MLDTELVQNIKENKDVEESIKGLIDLHQKLINKISYKYVNPLHQSGSSIDEIEKEKSYIVYKAALSFNDKKKTKFSSYLGSFVRWYCLNRINQTTDWKFTVDAPLDNIPEVAAPDSSTMEYVESLLNGFDDDKVKKVFELRFFSGDKLLPWNEIGEKMGGISGQTANNWYRRGVKLLKNRAISNFST